MANGEDRNGGERHGHQDRDMKLLDVVGLRMLANTIENEMLGRYVSNPENLEEIHNLAGVFMESMACLRNAYHPDGRCPSDWVHMRCKCVPPRLFERPGPPRED